MAPEEDVRESLEQVDEPQVEDAVQAQDCATVDDSVLKDVEKEPPRLDQESVSFIKMLARLAVNLALWVILFAINLGIQVLIAWLIGGKALLIRGTLVMGLPLLFMLIVSSTLELVLVWAFLDAASKKQESSDAPRSDS